MDAVTREPWADEVGFTGEEWSDFARLRRWYRSRQISCPWCGGTGENPVSWYHHACRACGKSGRVDRWTALHAPGDDPWDDVMIPLEIPLYHSDLSPRLARLRDRLEPHEVQCPNCDGAGRVGNNYACRTCDWTGQVSAFRAATHLTIACPQCDGAGIGGSPGGSWACGYCSMTGRIDLDRLRPWMHVTVGENYSLYLNIEDAVKEGNPGAYGTWPEEFNARQEARPRVRWSGVDFSRDDLSGLDLSHADLSGCEFGNVAGTRFVGADLSGVEFTRADARGADFTDANLSNARFGWEANARGANFTRANLSDADLSGVDLTGSTIHLADTLAGADLSDVKGLTAEQVLAVNSLGATGAAFPKFARSRKGQNC